MPSRSPPKSLKPRGGRKRGSAKEVTIKEKGTTTGGRRSPFTKEQQDIMKSYLQEFRALPEEKRSKWAKKQAESIMEHPEFQSLCNALPSDASNEQVVESLTYADYVKKIEKYFQNHLRLGKREQGEGGSRGASATEPVETVTSGAMRAALHLLKEFGGENLQDGKQVYWTEKSQEIQDRAQSTDKSFADVLNEEWDELDEWEKLEWEQKALEPDVLDSYVCLMSRHDSMLIVLKQKS
jgi:hypothetical protein